MKCQVFTTTFPKGNKKLKTVTKTFKPDTGLENEAVNLYPDATDQTWEGFGGAFTDSAGYVFSQMGETAQQRLLQTYFGEAGTDSMHYTLGRIPLDSCDFSLEIYEALSDPTDREMKSFSMERSMKYSLPFVKAALAAQKQSNDPLSIMVSPWSPPAFMKTNGERLHGGGLKPEYADFYADYLCRYIRELRIQGLKVCRLTLQNEPHAVQKWDSCIFTAAEERDFLHDHLWPALQKHGLSDVEVYLWDHNKERLYERACVILDEETAPMVAGFGIHWYSGDHFETVDLVHRRWPDKKLILSEACIEYRTFSAGNPLFNAQKYTHDMIGNFNAGMTAFYDWNLLLDQDGGPNYVDNYCDAPFMYDMEKNQLFSRPMLDYLWHFSHFIQPGAVRIGLSRYIETLEGTAFQNPDGSVVCVLLNRTAKGLPVNIRLQGYVAGFKLPARAIATAVIPKLDKCRLAD